MKTEAIEKVIGLLECTDSIKQGFKVHTEQHEFYGPGFDELAEAARAELTVINEKDRILDTKLDTILAGVAALKAENERLREALEAIVAKQKDDSMFRLPTNCEAMAKVRAALPEKP